MDGRSPRLGWAILACYFALVCATALSPIVPLTFDEAWSFLEFSRHGAGFSLTHYPLPNNHMAFSALQALVVREEFVAARPSLLRIGNLLCVAALLGLLFHIVRRRLALEPSMAAFAAIALSLCSPLFTLYLFVGRGYLLGSVLLLAAVHFGAIPGRRVATALLCALATWTVPTFAFATPGVLLALLLATAPVGASRYAWKLAAQSAALYTLTTLALYSPVVSDVLSQRTGWNETATPLAFAQQLWDLLGNALTFGLAFVGNALLLGLLAAGVVRNRRGREALALVAPVASFLFVVGLLGAVGAIATPFLRTASFAPLFLWLALVMAVRGSAVLERIAGVLVAFNVIAGIALFTATVGIGDPQQYPVLSGLSPSPLARAELARGTRIATEWDAVPAGRLYARAYGYELQRVKNLGDPPCAQGGRFKPRPQNRVAVAREQRLVCF